MFSCSYLVPWFKYKNIIMIKTVTLYKNFFFLKSLKSFKSKKKELVLPLFYHVSREIWLGNSKEFVQTNQDSTFSHTCEISKLFNKVFSYMLFLFLLKFHEIKERQVFTQTVCIEKKQTLSNYLFSKLKKFVSRSVFDKP